MPGISGKAFLPLPTIGTVELEVVTDRLGVSWLRENVGARGVDDGVARGVESSDTPVSARWRGVDGCHSSLSRRWIGRLRERIDSFGRSLKYDCSFGAEGMGGKAVGSSVSSIGVGAALVPIVVQLK